MVTPSRLPVAVLVFFLTACGSGISDKNLSYIDREVASLLIEGNTDTSPEITATTVLVDSRQSWEFRKSHIPNSINIPFGRLRVQAWRLDNVKTIIVSGETQNDSVSIAMSKALLSMGFTDVKTLRGGFNGWEKAGKPIETVE